MVLSRLCFFRRKKFGRFDIGLRFDIAQHGVIKIVLFQKEKVWKSRKEVRSAYKQLSTLLKKDVGSLSR